ncbi:MAG: hypothetical protein K2W96_00500, partial [Gemmataceae bacterium]|nr:hypothetical protein [Gemmataceae bacterium]
MVSEEEDEESKQTPVALVLMASPHLAGLAELRLADCALLDGSLSAIARNPAAASLRLLDLGSDGVANGFGTLGARELARSAYLGGLETLDVSEAPGVGDSGVLALVEATATLPRLKDLNIAGTDLSDAGALRISQCPGLARLERLRIGRWAYQDTPLGDPACKALLASPHLEKIQRLEIALEPEPDTARAMRKRWGKRLVLGK